MLQLNDLELASTFMGSDKGISLLEADAILVGLAGKKGVERSRRRRNLRKEEKEQLFVGEVVNDDENLTNRQESKSLQKKSTKTSSVESSGGVAEHDGASGEKDDRAGSGKKDDRDSGDGRGVVGEGRKSGDDVDAKSCDKDLPK